MTWILWSEISQTALIIIPEEAEALIPSMRATKVASAYLLTYAAPVTRSMTHFDNLDYYTIPALPSGWKPPTWLRIELGIFAGRLYFDFEDYAPLCDYLGLDADDTRKNGTTARETFATKPKEFLREWLAIRRPGQDITHTPMGYLCQGKKLEVTHPFFAIRVESTERATLGAGFDRFGVVKNEVEEVSEEESEGSWEGVVELDDAVGEEEDVMMEFSSGEEASVVGDRMEVDGVGEE